MPIGRFWVADAVVDAVAEVVRAFCTGSRAARDSGPLAPPYGGRGYSARRQDAFRRLRRPPVQAPRRRDGHTKGPGPPNDGYQPGLRFMLATGIVLAERAGSRMVAIPS